MQAATSAAGSGVAWRTVRCVDVDDQAAALDGWHQQYQQLSPGTFSGELVHAALSPGWCFFTEANNRHLSEQVAPPAGTFAFALRTDPGPDAKLNQTAFGRDDIVCIEGGHAASVTVPADSLLAAIVLPADDLLSYQAVVQDASGASFTERARVARSSMVPLLRGFVDQVLTVSRDSPSALAQPQARRALCSAAISNVLFAMTGDTAGPLAHEGTARRRWQIVERARAHVEAHMGDVFTVADVCKAIGVSRRTLQYCFEDVLQINPIAYIRAARLNAVRRDLKQADPGRDTVADIAALRGFWHLGHFAADYKRMFGESPSTTLHASRGG